MSEIENRISKRKRAVQLGKQLREKATELKAKGYSNSAIAKKLQLPESTTRNLLKRPDSTKKHKE